VNLFESEEISREFYFSKSQLPEADLKEYTISTPYCSNTLDKIDKKILFVDSVLSESLMILESCTHLCFPDYDKNLE